MDYEPDSIEQLHDVALRREQSNHVSFQYQYEKRVTQINKLLTDLKAGINGVNKDSPNVEDCSQTKKS